MSDNQSLDHPVLILVRGLPGSGKSYLAEELLASLKGLYGADTAVKLDPDATDYESAEYKEHVRTLTAEGVDPSIHAYRYLRAQAQQGVAAHKVVIWNQPFTNLEIFNKMTANLRNHAQEQGTDLPILVVEVHIDPATAKARVDERKQRGGHGPSDATFQRFAADYTSFASEGYVTVSINGEADVRESVATVLQALQNLHAS